MKRFYTTEKSSIRKWLNALNLGYDVRVPTRSIWKGLNDVSSLDIPSGVPTIPVKSFFFPQPETLLKFSTKRDEEGSFVLKEPERSSSPVVLYGVRPCDARSVELNAMPYENDPYYQEKRNNVHLIGLTCNDVCRTCFCRWVGGSPMGAEGLDIALYSLDEKQFVVEITSDKGELLWEKNPAPSMKSSESDLKALEGMKDKAMAAMESMEDTAARLRTKDLLSLYNASFWAKVSDSCINCGACTFLCPTCYCFDIQDEVIKGNGRRIRMWDSCMFPLFTLHASGHNPRGEKTQRVRNRFMHKLKYFPDRFGPISCVGCGRCVRECPVNIDIREVLRDILKV